MQTTPQALAVGVDLGSSTTTVSTCRDEDLPESQHLEPVARPAADGGEAADPSAQAPETDLPYRLQGPTPIGLAVPASWDAARRREHAEAAARAGFEWTVLVPEPEAAARYFTETQGSELEPGTQLVVCNLGAGSCRVDVVHREGDRYVVDAALRADDVCGDEFDRLVLAYLSGRDRTLAPDFWDRAEDPAENALRTSLLAEIKRAREHLSEHRVAAVGLPAEWPELLLTREELERCLAPAMARAAALVEEALHEAKTDAGQTAGILLIGGASRTPLAASMIRGRLGVEPVLPQMPEGVLAEGAAYAAFAHAQSAAAASAESAGPSRLRPSRGVLAAASASFVVVVAVIAMVLAGAIGPDEESTSGAVADDPGYPGLTDLPEGTSADAGQGGGEETGDPSSPQSPTEDGESASPTVEAAPSATVTPTQNATSGPVEENEDEDEDEGDEDGEQPAAAVGTVPDVVGMSREKARQALAEAGFTVVTTAGERRTGSEYTHCETIAQNPEGGTRQAFDKRITVTYVYVGSDDC